jgi:hypothetical protein
MPLGHSRTLYTFSKFCLNNQNSTNMKVVELWGAHFIFRMAFEIRKKSGSKSLVNAVGHCSQGLSFSPSWHLVFSIKTSSIWSSVRVYGVEDWPLYNSPIHRRLSAVQFLKDLEFWNRAVEVGLSPRAPERASARRPRGAQHTTARPRRPGPRPLNPVPKAHDTIPRDPRAYPPLAAHQNPVAPLPTRRPDPPLRSPPATPARVGYRAPPLNSPPHAPRHPLLTPCMCPPIKRPPVRLPARASHRRQPLSSSRRAHPSALFHRRASN